MPPKPSHNSSSKRAGGNCPVRDPKRRRTYGDNDKAVEGSDSRLEPLVTKDGSELPLVETPSAWSESDADVEASASATGTHVLKVATSAVGSSTAPLDNPCTSTPMRAVGVPVVTRDIDGLAPEPTQPCVEKKLIISDDKIVDGQPDEVAPDTLSVHPSDMTVVGHHPRFEGLAYVPLTDLERACGFAVMQDPRNHRYGLGQIPHDARWGTTATSDRFLTDGKDNVITAWLLGRVRSKWFYNMLGEPQGRVNIAITLPYKGDYNAIGKLVGMACPKREEYSHIVYASRFQTRQSKGESRPSVVPFRNIYDARERFRSKNNMQTLHASDLGPGDLVLVEAYVTRYKTAKDKKNKKGWMLWDVSFELQAVSLLYDAPAGLDDDDDLSHAAVNDADDDM